ncbi:hypothetical protein GQX74_010055 [Glossina fuscipes]|nr:hypothetical protein GQX74_010055 [Glossina fuscipes]
MKKKLHLRQRHNLRLQNSEKVRNCLPEDQRKANENPREYHEVSFDLQKAFLYPKLSVPKKKYIFDKTNVAARFYFDVITRAVTDKTIKKYRERIHPLTANSMDEILQK